MLGLPWISAPPATYKVNTGNELRSMGKSKLNRSFNHINERFSVPIIIHQALIHFNSNYLKEKACDHPPNARRSLFPSNSSSTSVLLGLFFRKALSADLASTTTPTPAC
jgi:hypothetical protein